MTQTPATPDIADLMAPSQGGITAEVVAGGATYNFAIIRLTITTPVPVGSRVRFDLDASLAVMPEPAGPRTVEVNLYDDLSEAIADEDLRVRTEDFRRNRDSA